MGDGLAEGVAYFLTGVPDGAMTIGATYVRIGDVVGVETTRGSSGYAAIHMRGGQTMYVQGDSRDVAKRLGLWSDDAW